VILFSPSLFCPGEATCGAPCPDLGSPAEKKNPRDLIERVQQKATKMMRGLELRDLGLFSLEKKRLRGESPHCL